VALLSLGMSGELYELKLRSHSYGYSVSCRASKPHIRRPEVLADRGSDRKFEWITAYHRILHDSTSALPDLNL